MGIPNSSIYWISDIEPFITVLVGTPFCLAHSTASFFFKIYSLAFLFEMAKRVSICTLLCAFTVIDKNVREISSRKTDFFILVLLVNDAYDKAIIAYEAANHIFMVLESMKPLDMQNYELSYVYTGYHKI